MQNPHTNATHPSSDDLALLSRVIHDVGRRARLSPDDALDFGQTVHLRLLECGYRPIRQFAGRSSLKTFLTVVVHRCLLDWRRTQLGKWRSSAAARRLGATAVTLERLVYRSGHTLAEAIEILQAQPAAPKTAELEQLALQIPVRLPIRTVSLETVTVHGTADFEDPIERAHDHHVSIITRRRLAAALRTLPSDDRTLLDLRYRQMMQVPAIARTLACDSKTLYRRCDKLIRSLRTALSAR